MSEQRDPKDPNRAKDPNWNDGCPSGASGSPGGAARPVRTYRSADMFAGGHEVIIEHKGAHYRLRQTSQGKLILTK